MRQCVRKKHIYYTRGDRLNEKPLTLDRVKVVFPGHHGQNYVFRQSDHAMRCCQHPVFVDYGSATHMSGRLAGDDLQRYLPRELACSAYDIINRVIINSEHYACAVFRKLYAFVQILISTYILHLYSRKTHYTIFILNFFFLRNLPSCTNVIFFLK